ncbi:uncharacterized WD repeat-containing protein c2a9.03 [Phtheirospermum japonicum]|uniref:Uncharacterized WD repeat-containing protein c2a9.03 n=1 Tax=Phtheirospermum japonicum TaxID=374723 RepID=A0A830D3I6_9LAMI|nr:uncharacterized WD repeat-containing protein c2a9.03 [Phtheirospermum japonicum]
MEQFQNHELEYVVDDYYDASDFEDDNVSGRTASSSLLDDSMDSDFDDDFELSKPKTDTSALEARNGKDIQGIQWERLNFTREEYRESRLKQYRNYENLSSSRGDLEKDCREVNKGHNFYDFQFNTRLVKSTIVHFQDCQVGLVSLFASSFGFLYSGGTRDVVLQIRAFVLILRSRTAILSEQLADKGSFRHGTMGDYMSIKRHSIKNLLWATSKHDVYLMQNYSVMHWSSLLRKGKEVLNVAKPIVPILKYPGCLAQPLSRVQISTITVKDNLMVAGGFQGELICKYLNQPGVAFCTKLSTDENAITNSVDIFHNPSGVMRIITANNDAQVRIMDTEKFTCLNHFTFPWSVNNTSVSPDSKMLAILGDSADCLIADAQSGKVISNLKGHLDYSFSSAWHPDGQILATGNQDTTCRLWDIRNLSESIAVLKGRMGAIRTIRFTSDGRFMAMAEPADFVHVFDTKSDYATGQEIDLFGEIAGISFSPDTEALFVGVADRTYGSLLEFNRRRHDYYLECVY